MEKSLLLKESQPESIYKASVRRNGTYYWNTPRHTDESNCGKDHDEENDPKSAFSRVFDIFPMIRYYSGLWVTYTISCVQVTRSGIQLNLREEWGKGWS